MAHFSLPLDLPHAGRLAERISNLLERYADEKGVDATTPLETAEGLASLLFRFSANDENPPEEEGVAVRDEAARLGRQLVDELQAANISHDRLGQYVRNLFECLELGEEGAEISLRAGENPNSIQRPV